MLYLTTGALDSEAFSGKESITARAPGQDTATPTGTRDEPEHAVRLGAAGQQIKCLSQWSPSWSERVP